MKIADVHAREIFDSRGIPTIECDLILADGMVITSSVPSGMSKSSFEAYEKRDGGDRLRGLGVLKVVASIEKIIAPELINKDTNLVEMDMDLLEIDGTDDKSQCGANALLAVSMAVCKAQAYNESLPLYELIARMCNNDLITLPLPMFNCFGGGAHAYTNFPLQEVLIVPVGAESFRDAMDVGSAVFYALRSILIAKGMSTAVGFEGEFVPQFKNIYEAFDLVMDAIKKSGYEHDVMISIDCAANSFYNHSTQKYMWENKEVDAYVLIEWYKKLMQTYPIYSLEDGLAESDWDNWKVMKHELGKQIKIIGDDIFATNPQRIWHGIENDSATTVLIKPNQIGTVTETLQSILLCRENGWDSVVSHRSGETNDSFIADLAVGANAMHIKAGGFCRGERMAKYNRLLYIEDDVE